MFVFFNLSIFPVHPLNADLQSLTLPQLSSLNIVYRPAMFLLCHNIHPHPHPHPAHTMYPLHPHQSRAQARDNI